jgi:tetratricopeptide (TPR) repeat protein
MAAAPVGLAEEEIVAGAQAVERAATGDPIEGAWRAPAESLEQRVERTRRSSLEAGVWSLDPAARSLLRGTGHPVARARAAVRLAPDLPAARMALAHALWRRGDSPFAALHEALGALAAFLRHLEAALWLAGSGLAVLAVGLAAGGLACIGCAGALAAPHAAHDLGDALGGGAPASARMALVLFLLLAPVLVGEGLLGVALGVLGLGALYGSRRERIALAAAAGAVWLGAFPVAALAGRGLEVLARDPVVSAALSADRGSATAVDLARLRAAAARQGSIPATRGTQPAAASEARGERSTAGRLAADGRPDRLASAQRAQGERRPATAASEGPPSSDALAGRMLARLARRSGRLGEADARYRRLLDDPAADAALANDAANVRLRLGDVEAALALYERSLAAETSPAVLFNLSQASARAFEVEDLTRALERAQALDGELVAELTHLQGAAAAGHFVVDLPLPARALWARLWRASDGRALAGELRRPFAPGRLGAAPGLALAALATAVVAGSLGGVALRRSRWCARCGRRTCPRCERGVERRAEAARGVRRPAARDAAPEEAGLCGGCHRLFFQPEQTQRELRVARVAALEQRRRRLDRAETLAGLLLPGAAGLLAQRPLRALLACVAFATAAAAAVWRDGVVPDPGVVGGAGPAALLALAALAGFAYAGLLAASLAARRTA